ncbi:SPOR domain-containing protein [Candidatus Vallotia lariciata]|uniref:SPOR domain-containing protein n=1 Tax=Candidatus Vallotia laricis TaxID=2018052 RepID=UPI001D015D75|nr:SPOR domain-containing protein [Candidatus Vallotia lariciata]
MDLLWTSTWNQAIQTSQHGKKADRYSDQNSILPDLKLSMKQRARRRLIGAIVLLLGAIVSFPLILDSSPKISSKEDIVIQIPERLKSVPDNLSRRETAIKDRYDQAQIDINTSLNAVSPGSNNVASPGSKPNILSGSYYVVQLGVLNNDIDAQHWVRRLKSIGVPAYFERQYQFDSNKERILLRAGPFSDRSAATNAVTKVRRAVDLNSGHAGRQ